MFRLLRRFTLVGLFAFSSSAFATAQTSTSPTDIAIGTTVQRNGVKHLGINLGNQTYFDSRQMMSNLLFRNPGFEGEQWQSILHCMVVTATSCTDDHKSTVWPANFLQGASVEFVGGAANGTFTSVTSSAAAVYASGLGVTVNFPTAVNPAVGDYLVVRMNVPGNAQAGWSTRVTGASTITTEYTDLSPNTIGKQAIRLTAPTSSLASVTSYMDSISGKSFVQLNGTYTLTFRAKLIAGAQPLVIGISRIGAKAYYQVAPALTNTWQDYSYSFSATDSGETGTLQAVFGVTSGTVLLDDVSLAKAPGANNPTAFRDEVVNTLRDLNPGLIRYMDSGTDWGSSVDNMIAPAMARLRAGYNDSSLEMDDIPMGLNEFLVLCKAVGTEPWYTMSAGMSAQEMTNLMDFLGGDASTPYGARRIALGQVAPWSSVFSQIHLEFGNEVWNTANPGLTFSDSNAYGKRTGVIFGAAKASPSYDVKKFDLIIDGWESAPAWTKPVLAASANYDTISQAAYIYGPLTDESSNEALFGPLFSIPEQASSSALGGVTALRVSEANAAARPAKTAIYEANMGTVAGTVSQTAVNNLVPSLGAGLATAANLLVMMRDQGVLNMANFTLAQYGSGFYNSATGASLSVPLYGMVVDMGGTTNLRRPSFLAEQLANQAIRPILLATSQAGNNPTWNQAALNGAVASPTAHYIQSFAFTDGTTNTIVLFNLSRTTALPVTFSGSNAPSGDITVATLTSSAITNNNETTEQVWIEPSSLSSFNPATGITLPPFSMTTLTSSAPAISSMAISCAASTLYVNGNTLCSSSITGTGTFSGSVKWSATAGTVSTAGLYTAPATAPAGGSATITAVATQDSTKSATQTIAIGIPITGVTVTCPSSSIQFSATDACTAVVSGSGAFNSAVTWSATGGVINQSGLLTAPASAATMVVTATSVQDPTKFGTYTVAAANTPILTNLVFSNVTPTSVTVSWISNVPTEAGYDYGPTYAISVMDKTKYTTTPSFTITGLTAGTSYKFLAFGFSQTAPTSGYLLGNFTTATGSVSGVTVNCVAASVAASATDACTSTVAGSAGVSSSVTWSVTGGTVSTTGLVTAPATAGSIVVKATSVQDPTKSASYTITTLAAVSGVTVSCASSSVAASATDACAATVAGSTGVSNAVTWSTTAGSISSTGLLTAPATAATITVKATSVQDPTKFGSYIVTTPAPTVNSIAVSCAAASVNVSAQDACSASVTGTTGINTSVTWTATGGSISSTGLVTAPATAGTIVVKATSVQDATKSASYTITAVPTVNAVVVTCASSSVAVSGSDACSASVTGSTGVSTAVNWSASVGSISSTGLLIAPPTAATILVKATSVVDSTKFATYTVTTPPPTVNSIAVSCATASVNVTALDACSSVVTGSTGVNTGVTWSTSAGSITSTGLLTAPTTAGTVVVKAVSLQDPTKSASYTVTTLAPTITSLKLSCPAIALAYSTTETCTANVTGTTGFSNAVNWSASAGSISSTGLLTAPASDATIIVTATSAQDPTKSATFSVASSSKPTMSNFVASNLTATSATLSWNSSVPTMAGINYGPTYNLTAYDATKYTSSPTFTLTNLTPGTVYKILLFGYSSQRVFGNQIVIFTTPAK